MCTPPIAPSDFPYFDFFTVPANTATYIPGTPSPPTLRKKRAIWLSVTQLSMELHFGVTLYRRAVSEQKKRSDLALHVKESRFGCDKTGSPLKNSTKFRSGSPREPK